MSFVRTVKRETPFVQMDKRSIGTGDLSLKATGLLLYFLSKPDNWQIRLKDVEKRFTDGLDSVRSGMKELEKVGYVYKYRERDEKGRLADWIYYVYELPQYNPYLNAETLENKETEPKRDFPKQENPTQGKPKQENPTYSNKELSNKDLKSSSSTESHSGLVIQFYEQNFGGTMNEVMIDFCHEWTDNLSAEVTIEALKIAKENFARNPIKYAISILKEWELYKIKTVEKVAAYEEMKQQQKEAANGWNKPRDAGRAGRTKRTFPEEPKYGFEKAGY